MANPQNLLVAALKEHSFWKRADEGPTSFEIGFKFQFPNRSLCALEEQEGLAFFSIDRSWCEDHRNGTY